MTCESWSKIMNELKEFFCKPIKKKIQSSKFTDFSTCYFFFDNLFSNIRKVSLQMLFQLEFFFSSQSHVTVNIMAIRSAMSVLKFISLILLSLLIFVSFHCRPTSSWFQAPMLHGIDIWIDVQGCCHWSVFITHCATDEKEGFNFNKFEQGLVVTMLDDHWSKIILAF